MPVVHTVATPRTRVKTIAIVSSGFLVAIATGSTSLGLVFFMRELYHVPAGTVGLLAGTNSLTYVAGCLLLRPVFRRIRSRHCLLIATGGAAAMVLGVLLVRSVALTFVLYGVVGFVMAFFWSPLAAWLSHGLESRALAGATSLFNLSWSLGSIVSSLAAGALSEVHPSSPLRLSAALFASTFTLLVTIALLSPSIRHDQHRDAAPAGSGERDQSTPTRYPAWFGLFAAWTAVGMLMNVFPLYAREVLGISKSGIGVLLLFRALATATAFLLLGKVSFWHFRVWVMVAGQTAFAALVGTLAFTRSAAAIGAVLAGIGLRGAFAYSSSIFHGMSGSPERARRMGIHEAVLSVGLVLGSTAGGFVYQRFTMPVVFVGCAMVLLASAAAQALFATLARAGGGTSGGSGLLEPRDRARAEAERPPGSGTPHRDR